MNEFTTEELKDIAYLLMIHRGIDNETSHKIMEELAHREDMASGGLQAIREYAEGYPVEISKDEETGREVIIAQNEGGHNCTMVDLLDVVEFYFKRK